jgi:hypothetical protein
VDGLRTHVRNILGGIRKRIESGDSSGQHANDLMDNDIAAFGQVHKSLRGRGVTCITCGKLTHARPESGGLR